MTMRRWLILLIVLAPMGLARAERSPSFDVTLKRLARVAELYRDTALGFACEETIVSAGEKTKRLRLAYIFIKGDDGRLRDFRTWRTGVTEKQRGEEVDPIDYGVPRYLASAYLWAFVFRSDRQPHYRLKLIGEDEVLRRPALKIQFVPVPPIRTGVNDWAGFAWIDRETSQILKFDSYTPADWSLRAQVAGDVDRAAARSPLDEKAPYLVDKIVTEFGLEKNGMRFPTRVEMTTTRTEVRYGGTGDPLRERVIHRVVQDYANFQFFSVRTSEAINRFVNGEGPLASTP